MLPRYSKVEKSFSGGMPSALQDRVAVAGADLVADDLVDLFDRPAELAEERLPGPQAEIDAVLQHRRRRRSP